MRDSSCDLGPIAEGDWLGISRDGIVGVGPDVASAAEQLLRRLITDDHELVIDATLPLVDIVAPADMSTTRDARPVISGTASAGATVELT